MPKEWIRNLKERDKVFVQIDRYGAWRLATICEVLNTGKLRIEYPIGKKGDTQKILFTETGKEVGTFNAWDYQKCLSEYTLEEYTKRLAIRKTRLLIKKLNNYDFNKLNYETLKHIDKIIRNKKKWE